MYEDEYPLLDCYYCSNHNKFFDELNNYDLFDCMNNHRDCDECPYCLKIDQLDRFIKFKDGEIEFLNFTS